MVSTLLSIHVSSPFVLDILQGPRTLQDAEESLRRNVKGGRSPHVPPASAWTTMETIAAKAKARTADRKRKLEGIKEESSALLQSPQPKKMALDGQGPKGQERSQALQGLVTKLEKSSGRFTAELEAVHTMAHCRVTLEEARRFKFLQFVHARAHRADTPLPLKHLCTQLLALWQ